MTTPSQPEPVAPHPRDIAVEMETQEVSADLEERGDPQEPANPA